MTRAPWRIQAIDIFAVKFADALMVVRHRIDWRGLARQYHAALVGQGMPLCHRPQHVLQDDLVVGLADRCGAKLLAVAIAGNASCQLYRLLAPGKIQQVLLLGLVVPQIPLDIAEHVLRSEPASDAFLPPWFHGDGKLHRLAIL